MKRPPLHLVKGEDGKLFGLTAYDAQRLDEVPLGLPVQATLYRRRSNKHNSLYWVILGEIAHNSEIYLSAEDLHRVLKISLGYTRKIKLFRPSPRAKYAEAVIKVLKDCRHLLDTTAVVHSTFTTSISQRIDKAVTWLEEFKTDCEMITLEDSTAFDSMDQAQFNEYYLRAMNELRKAGYDVDAYEAEAKNKMKSLPNPERPNVSERQEAA
jgi:hypothetical protein